MNRPGWLLVTILACFLTACAVAATRPVQEMSDTGAALKAAKEVSADTLAPELYRQANEWFAKARNEYKLKNFKQAKDYADRSRRFAEQAEFESIKNGGNRQEVPNDPLSPPPPVTPTAPATASPTDAPPPPPELPPSPTN